MYEDSHLEMAYEDRHSIAYEEDLDLFYGPDEPICPECCLPTEGECECIATDEWPDTPYCNGQISFLADEPRHCPTYYTAGTTDGGAGEWYAGYDAASQGKYYDA